MLELSDAVVADLSLSRASSHGDAFLFQDALIASGLQLYQSPLESKHRQASETLASIKRGTSTRLTDPSLVAEDILKQKVLGLAVFDASQEPNQKLIETLKAKGIEARDLAPIVVLCNPKTILPVLSTELDTLRRKRPTQRKYLLAQVAILKALGYGTDNALAFVCELFQAKGKDLVPEVFARVLVGSIREPEIVCTDEVCVLKDKKQPKKQGKKLDTGFAKQRLVRSRGIVDAGVTVKAPLVAAIPLQEPADKKKKTKQTTKKKAQKQPIALSQLEDEEGIAFL
jgi:hypothetical protein